MQYTKSPTACLAPAFAGIDLRVRDEEELDLHGSVERQGVCANCRSRVATGVAEQFDQEFAGAIGDTGLGGEVRVAGDERANPGDASDLVDPAWQSVHGGERVDHTLSRRRFCDLG